MRNALNGWQTGFHYSECLLLLKFLIPSALKSHEGTACYECCKPTQTVFCIIKDSLYMTKVMNVINALHLWQSFFPMAQTRAGQTFMAEQQPGATLLCNTAPVYPVLFWANKAAVTSDFLLPVRLCIISTDSTLLKRYAEGYAAGNVSKKNLCKRIH